MEFRSELRSKHSLLWGPVVLYYAVISLFSAITPFDELASRLGSADKVAHFLEFGLFGALIARSLSWENFFHHIKNGVWVVILALIPVLAGLDEFHQAFVPGRTPDFHDWLADIAGTCFGMLVGLRIYARRIRAFKK